MLFTERRRKFGPNEDEILLGLRELHNVELHNVQYSTNVIRIIKSRKGWARNIECIWVKRNSYNILVGKPKRKRSLVKLRYKYADNIKMDVRWIGWCGMEWIDVIQDRV
jgi:hypothetical protein